MVGNRIKYLREELNLKQDELAEKIGVSASAIGMYERDLREANDEIKIKMCQLFNCSMDYLTGNSDIRNPEKIENDKINIGLSTKDYNPPTEEQQKKIEEFAKFVLQENKKKKDNKN